MSKIEALKLLIKSGSLSDDALRVALGQIQLDAYRAVRDKLSTRILERLSA